MAIVLRLQLLIGFSPSGKAEALGMRLRADAYAQYGEVMLMLKVAYADAENFRC